MTTEPTTSAPRRSFGGTGLLLLVSFATIFTVTFESLFIHWASWALLAAVVAQIIIAAVVIVAAVGRLIDDGEIAAAPAPRQTAEAAQAPAPARTAPAPRAVLGH
jgi:hypothetical protein